MIYKVLGRVHCWADVRLVRLNTRRARERSRGGWTEHQHRASGRLRGRGEVSRRQETRLVVPITGQNMSAQLLLSPEISWKHCPAQLPTVGAAVLLYCSA